MVSRCSVRQVQSSSPHHCLKRDTFRAAKLFAAAQEAPAVHRSSRRWSFPPHTTHGIATLGPWSFAQRAAPAQIERSPARIPLSLDLLDLHHNGPYPGLSLAR